MKTITDDAHTDRPLGEELARETDEAYAAEPDLEPQPEDDIEGWDLCENPAQFEIYPKPAVNCEDVTYACRAHVGEFLPDGWAHIRPLEPFNSGAHCCYMGVPNSDAAEPDLQVDEDLDDPQERAS